jgi:DMSO/TMAO reductase YedYZ molybdopterin-dependent catalytic subunit
MKLPSILISHKSASHVADVGSLPLYFGLSGRLELKGIQMKKVKAVALRPINKTYLKVHALDEILSANDTFDMANLLQDDASLQAIHSLVDRGYSVRVVGLIMRWARDQQKTRQTKKGK